jgi:uncharacterized protein with HEPN domain
MKPRDREVLEAIAESARLADEYARDEGPDWLADSRTVDAVAKRVEQIGELARHLSPEILALMPNVPWRKVKGARTFLAHDYENVDLDILREVVTDDLPILRAAVGSTLSEADGQD